MDKRVDTDLLKARRLIVRQKERINLVLIGCGGTGSWLAPHIARLARVLITREKNVQVLFIDPDIVEEKNTWRQNFCRAELGRNKAVTLAARYGLAWGVEISALPGKFDPEKIKTGDLTVLIGCVDNAAARRQIAQKFSGRADTSSLWWLDCGNTQSYGQVLLGNKSGFTSQEFNQAFEIAGLCSALPAPHVQHPELLEDEPPSQEPAMSCAEIAQFQVQSLTINQRVAVEAADYLLRMLVSGELTRFTTYFSMDAGSARSVYITPENVAKVYGGDLCQKRKSRSKNTTTPRE